MARTFKTIGSTSVFHAVFQPAQESVLVGGREVLQNRDLGRVRITDTATTVTDEQADLLAKTPAYGSEIIEVTGVQEAAEAAAEELEEKSEEEDSEDASSEEDSSEGASSEGDSSGEPGELQAVPSVTDTNGAVQFLAGKGASAEDMQDKNGNLHHGKIEAAARSLGYDFPNYGR